MWFLKRCFSNFIFIKDAFLLDYSGPGVNAAKSSKLSSVQDVWGLPVFVKFKMKVV